MAGMLAALAVHPGQRNGHELRILHALDRDAQLRPGSQQLQAPLLGAPNSDAGADPLPKPPRCGIGCQPDNLVVGQRELGGPEQPQRTLNEVFVLLKPGVGGARCELEGEGVHRAWPLILHRPDPGHRGEIGIGQLVGGRA
jgi:hypothetical protein